MLNHVSFCGSCTFIGELGVRTYCSIKDYRGPKKRGRSAQSYKFFNKLDKVLGDKACNNYYTRYYHNSISCNQILMEDVSW